MPTNLTYSIFEGLLVGFANRRMFHISALSGGEEEAPSMYLLRQ